MDLAIRKIEELDLRREKTDHEDDVFSLTQISNVSQLFNKFSS